MLDVTGLEKPNFHPHNIKLTISPEMDYWLTTLTHSTPGLAPKPRVWFLLQLFLDPVQASSGSLVPLDGDGSLVLVLGGLDKPRRAGQCLLSLIWSAVSTRKVQ